MLVTSFRAIARKCSLQNSLTLSGPRNGKRWTVPKKSRVTYLALIARTFSSKQESYFSAIGGGSDEPPPNLTPEQVTNILRTNEKSLQGHVKPLVKIEANQLASNHPIEDRLRASQITLKDDANSLIFGVFDGHGGGLCADVVSRRLFHYVAIALSNNPVNTLTKETIEDIVKDMVASPDPTANMTKNYDEKSFEGIRQVLLENERRFLKRFAERLEDCKNMTVEERIREAFLSCDNDIAEEIEFNLSHEAPNFLLHFYYTLAVSGCCSTVILVHNEKAYVANTGDCRAVLGFKRERNDELVVQAMNLSKDHNSDNLDELKRIYSEHPAPEKNQIIKHNRLLGQLMPLRAFGDFGYKWSAEKMKKVGLLRAFGPHVIPPNYKTPPYLIAEPEITVYNMSEIASQTGDMFVVLATDGLWEQFENARHVIKQAFYHNSHDKKYPSPECSNLDEVSSTASGAPLDVNAATHLMRFSLGHNPSIVVDPHISADDQRNQEHQRLVTFLTLPESVVRNFRDDISVIVIHLSNS
ncbi:[Pyruvate dehydrogenase [acetyl-transferring]]-phosphatase 2, mitochondrial [Halotydeus destructor]|nr:[Pyruvate dehydrogenase [acetyl-transferring]]-phosphatase 2, mitochondrial [Halotydeus destructor]